MALDDFLSRLCLQPAVLVTVGEAQGSTPREAGAWMAVFPDEILGSIGGGHLEWQAIAHARAMLSGTAESAAHERRYPLGPSLGQCCGGVVHLRFEVVDHADMPLLATRLAESGAPVALFGGGHVGKALIKLLGDLPFEVTWIDSRDEVFPPQVPGNVRCEHSDPVQAAVAGLKPGSSVVIMSFSHAEDLDIVLACLLRQRAVGDLRYIGLIGSQTKWSVFQRRLIERGVREDELTAVTCPIGLPGIAGKAPAVVALAVAAQLMQVQTGTLPDSKH